MRDRAPTGETFRCVVVVPYSDLLDRWRDGRDPRSAVVLGQALGMPLPPFPVVNADPAGEDLVDPRKRGKRSAPRTIGMPDPHRARTRRPTGVALV